MTTVAEEREEDLGDLVLLQAKREGYREWELGTARSLTEAYREVAGRMGKPLKDVLNYRIIPGSLDLLRLLDQVKGMEAAPRTVDELRQRWDAVAGDFQDIKACIAGEAHDPYAGMTERDFGSECGEDGAGGLVTT